METKRKSTIQLAVLCALLLFAIALSASVGSADLSMIESVKVIFGISDAAPVYTTIIRTVRLPRIVLAGLVGAGLALAGTVFQGLFQNPLADPNILGVSSGAALGATLAMVFGAGASTFALWGIGLIGICAFVGAICTTLLVYFISRSGGRGSNVHIVLAGTPISSMMSAIISIIMIFNREQVEKVYFWTMGSFSAATWVKVGFLALFVLLCMLGMFRYSRELDAISTGEDTAATLGVDTVRCRKHLILLASLLVAACVSVSGIIGFVGLIIPHILRLLTGSSHRRLLPFSALFGAAFLILCDTAARTAASPSEIPVGAVTALFGAPFFIFLLWRDRRQ